jgi:hypothetical protein
MDPWLDILGLAATLLAGLLVKNIAYVCAIISAGKKYRWRVCLELIRLRRKDAVDLPSYLEQDSTGDPQQSTIMLPEAARCASRRADRR